MSDGDLIDALSAAPERFRALCHRIDDVASAEPDSDEWSPRQIWEHVRASDAILRPRVFQILVRPDTRLAAFDERRWARATGRANLPVDLQMSSFAITRAELVALLRALSEAEWELTGEHEELGRQTIRDVCRKIAEHEAEHVAQLETAARE